MIRPFLGRARAVVLPGWVRWAALGVLLLVVYGAGRLHEARRGADAMLDYVNAQVTASQRIARAQTKVVTVTETVYRDRIQKIYVQGEQIENRIPDILPPDIDRRLPLPAGFVRILDAAWAGDAVGPASDSDGKPASVPASLVAANEAANATSCRAWREKVFGWREFYAKQQIAINGKAGDWAATAQSNASPEQ